MPLKNSPLPDPRWPLARRGRLAPSFSDPATGEALSRWRSEPAKSFVPWLALSGLISVGMLVSVWLVASASTPFYEALPLEGRNLGDLATILERNVLVLALHGFACVAAYLAGAAVPRGAERYTGWRRRAYLASGSVAMVLVGLLILRSLAMQVAVLGHGTAALADGLGSGEGQLLLMLSLHAVPELTGMFLPLAAWLVLQRGGRHEQMFAAAIASCLIGAALILAAGVIEVWVTPHLVERLLG